MDQESRAFKAFQHILKKYLEKRFLLMKRRRLYPHEKDDVQRAEGRPKQLNLRSKTQWPRFRPSVVLEETFLRSRLLTLTILTVVGI